MTNRLCHLVAVLCLVSAGCRTSEQNPSVPRANTGYVDFFTDSSLGLSWEVKRASEPDGELRTVFSEYKPVPGSTLRLATPPGRYRFQVWFSNQVTEGPQTVLVEVADGKVTPVHVTLTSAGSTSVDRKAYGFRPMTGGYSRGTKTLSGQSEVFQIGAVAGRPEAYQPKERMPYF